MANTRTRLAVLGSAAALAAGTLAPVQLAGAHPAAAAAAHQWVALGDSSPTSSSSACNWAGAAEAWAPRAGTISPTTSPVG